MKKGKRLSILLIALSIMMCAAVLCSCGIFGGDDGEDTKTKSFTISCSTEMNAGERVEITIKKSYDFDMYHKDYEWKIVGDNDVEGSFEFEEGDNYTKKFFRALKPGTVKIQATNSTSGLLTSNIVEITVKGSYITTVEQLKALNGSNSVCILGNDLDLSSEGNWTPIENFSGTLSGNGKSISGLKLSVKSADNVGLFGELKGNVIGLKLTDISISGSGSGNNVGGIAGKNSGKISGCEVSGNIDCEYAANVGGIVGSSNCNLTDNINNAKVKSLDKVGGIAGRIGFDGNQTLGANVSNGDIQGKTNVGGIAGTMESICTKGDTIYTVTISDCENSGKVTASGDYAGGIAGQATGYYNYAAWTYYQVNLEITDCENKGVVTGRDYVGGIYGYGGDYVKSVTACVNSADISGANYVGGYVGYSKNTELKNMNNENKISGKAYLGGIAGYAGNVQNCKNDGEVISAGTIVEDNKNKCYVGGIAGYARGASNCENNSDITVTEAGANVGGVAGYISGSFSNESNENSGDVTAISCDNVGGIAGMMYFGGTMSVRDNVNKGEVQGKTHVGGIAGTMESICTKGDTIYTVTISDCENSGKVMASGDYAGGIAGQATGYYNYAAWTYYQVNLEIADCENKGIVTGRDYVGGIYGYGGSYVKSVTACVNSVDIAGENYVGGYVGYSKNTALKNMNNVNEINGKAYLGGIAGYAGNVQNCKNDGEVISAGTIVEDNKNKYYVGGIAGYATGLANCENNTDIAVTEDGTNVGGLIGYLYCDYSIESNVNKGSVKAALCDNVGGIVGAMYFHATMSVRDTVNNGEVQGKTHVGGIAGTMESICTKGDTIYTVTISDCENNGKVTASGDYAGGIAGQATGYYNYAAWTYYQVNLEIAGNKNSGQVSASSNFAAIVGKAGSYVNVGDTLWATNTNSGQVANNKLYN